MTQVAREDPPAHGGLAGGSALILMAQVSSNLGYLVAVVIVARALGPEGRGLLGFVTVAAILVARLSKVGLSETTTVFAAQKPEIRGALLSNLLVFSSLAALLVGGIAAATLAALPGARPAGLTDGLILLLLVGGVSATLCDTGFLLGCGEMRQLAVRTASAGWIYAACLGVTMVVVDLTASTAVTAWIVSQLLLAAFLHLMPARRQTALRPSLSLLSRSLRFGMRAWAGGLSLNVTSRGDQLLLGFMAGEAVLGYYAIAVNLSEVLFYLPAAASVALMPLVAHRTSAAAGALTALLFRSVAVIASLTTAAAAVAGPPLLVLLFGDAFAPATDAFLLLLPGVLGYTAMVIFSRALLGLGRPGLSALPPLAAAVLCLGLDLVLIPPLGAEGAAMAASASLLAGGTVGASLFLRSTALPAGSLLPRTGDLDVLLAPLRRAPRGGRR